MNNTIYIDKMYPEDWNQVREIYIQGIATGNATFQKVAPSWEEWDHSHLSECRIIARTKENVLGWAALSQISSRCVYSGVAEVSVYVSNEDIGKGIGSLLLGALIDTSERHGLWTLQSSIFPENKSSIKLHIKYGFREVGRRERIGKLDDKWRDTILFERRSNKVGVN